MFLPPRWLSYEVPPDQKDALVKRYGELFREVTALLRSHGIPLVVIFIPSAHKVRKFRALRNGADYPSADDGNRNPVS